MSPYQVKAMEYLQKNCPNTQVELHADTSLIFDDSNKIKILKQIWISGEVMQKSGSGDLGAGGVFEVHFGRANIFP